MPPQRKEGQAVSETITYPVAPAPIADDATAALRNELIGGRVNIEQIAAALGRTTRSIYNLIDRERIPYVRVLGVRYLKLDDVRRALVGDPAPRRRGRPASKA
jgi:hypothetical protein